MMIREQAIQLLDLLPPEYGDVKNKLSLDIVFDSGAFNGSYLLGASYYLKEMERRNLVEVHRVSGSSVGAMMALLYVLDSLDDSTQFYDLILENFRNKYTLESIKAVRALFASKVTPEVMDRIQGRLYIAYYNMKTGKKIVRSTYKSVDDLFDTVIRSCFIPYLVDGNLLYKDKYMDGFNPYVFRAKPKRRVLFMDLYGLDKIGNFFSIKNEHGYLSRALAGVLDVHNFFVKKSSTYMCSYVDEWSYLNKWRIAAKRSIEYLFYSIVLSILFFQKNAVLKGIDDILLYKLGMRVLREIYVFMLETYCF